MGKAVVVGEELERLERLEHQHEKGRADAVDALRKIHDQGLYVDYGTWEAYLRKRWDYSKTYGKYLIGFAQLRDECKKQGVEFLPGNERQVRPIVTAATRKKIDPVAAWQMACDTAPKVHDVPQVTGEHVQSALGHFGISGRRSGNREPQEVAELKSVVTKVTHSKAFKLSGHDFVEKFGVEAIPSRFKPVLDWMLEIAEVAPEALVDD